MVFWRVDVKIDKQLCIALAGMVLLTACGKSTEPVAGIQNIQVIPVNYALVRQLQTADISQSRATVAARPSRKETQPAEYRIGAGDQLFIALYVSGGAGNRELVRLYPPMLSVPTASDNFEVPQNGIINLPYIGDVELLDKSAATTRIEIAKKLAKYFKNPQVEVKIMDYNAHHFTISGEVAKPGEQKINNKNLTVLTALEAAGGATPAADLQNTELRHADGSVEKLDLLALVSQGDTSQNRLLHEGDVLTLPANHRNKVFVMGEFVKTQAQFIPKGRLTLTEAINDADGLDKVTASKSRVYVIRGAVGEEVLAPHKPGDAPKLPAPLPQEMQVKVYQLDASEPEAFVVADQFLLKPRDVVYVSSSPITDWNRFVSQLIPASVQTLLYGAIYTNN